MNEINPADQNSRLVAKIEKNIEEIEGNIENARLKHTQIAEELGFQLNVIKTVKPLWVKAIPSPDSTPVLTSGDVVVSGWLKQSEEWNMRSEHDLDEIKMTSSTASGIGYNTMSMLNSGTISTDAFVDFEPLKKVLSENDEKAFVESRLRLIDPTLANDYRAVWQNMNLPAFDQARGPLFLMRQVFDHFLDAMAPNTNVLSQPEFVPNPELKERNGTGITRVHRIQFVANHWIKDLSKRQQVLNSTKYFTDVYNNLNKAHERKALNEEAAKNSVYSASNLIAEWLKAIDFSSTKY